MLRLALLVVSLLGLGALPSHASGSASITGTLRDPSGAPVRFECVEAQLADDTAWQAYPDLTDENGQFDLAGLPPASYRLRFGCHQSEWVQTWLGGDTYDSATTITLADGETRAVEGTVFKGGRLAGRVVDDAGEPVRTTVYTAEGPDWEYSSTDDQGRFDFTGLRPGVYRLSAGSEKHVLSSGRVIDGLVFVQPGRGRIAGEVVDAAGVPQPDVCANAVFADGDSYGAGRTDASGAYVIDDVPARAATIRFTDCGGEQRFPTSYLGGVYRQADAAYLDVIARQTTQAPRQVMPAGGAISGTLTGPDGQPFASGCVNVPVTTDHGGDVRHGWTDASGHYTVRALPPGQFTVWMGACSSDTLLGQAYGGEHGNRRDTGTPVAVSEGVETTGIDGTLIEGAVIEGTLSHATEGTAQGCVAAYEAGDPTGYTGWAFTSAAGNFRIGPLRAGDHRIHVNPCSGGAWAAEWWQDKQTHAEATPVLTVLSQTTTGVTPVVSSGSTVSGTVRLAGQPVAGACVRLTAGGQPWPMVFGSGTDAAGAYAVTRVPAGTYSVSVLDCREGRFNETTLPEPLVLGHDQTVSGFDLAVSPAPPVVTGITPSSGSGAGGDVVAVVGHRLRGVTEVRFGDQAASGVTTLSGNQVDVVVPPGQPGTTVDVVAIGPGGQSAPVELGRYTYTSAPRVAAVSPAAGPVEGGNEVRITGGLLSGATAVRFGGVAAPSLTVESDSALVAAAPAGSAAGPVDVQVETPGGLSQPGVQYTYEAPLPVVLALSPAAGPLEGDNPVRIDGVRLEDVSEIRFGDRLSTSWSAWGGETVWAWAPAADAPGVVPVTVTTPLGTSRVTAASQYEYVARPTVSAVTPAAGPEAGGGQLSVAGTGFDKATELHLGSRSVPFSVQSPTTIVADIPPGSGTVEVRVFSPGGMSDVVQGAHYTWVPAPVIETVSPGHGSVAGGSPVTLTGAGLAHLDSLTVDGAAVPFTVGPEGQVTFTAPAHERGRVDIAASSIGGSTVRAGAFRYVDAPHVTSVGAGSGPVTGSTVTVTGVDFVDVAKVELHELRPVVGPTVTPLTYRVLSDGAVSVDLPPHLPGDVFVSVTTAYGSSPAGEGRYTYRVGLPQ